MPFKFENLTIWQKALDLTDEVDKLTKKSFPKDELFILTPQIKRAADSVVLNIAEGCTGQTDPVFKNFSWLFLKISSGSCILFIYSTAKRFVEIMDFQMLYNDYETLIKMITALRNSL